MIIRHFDTVRGTDKIKFNESLEKSHQFVYYISEFLDKYPEIKKIKFYTSDQDRTIITSLILSSKLKSEIIRKKINNLQVYDPTINNKIDRDPKKKYKIQTCNYFKYIVDKTFDDKTLYIYITHSSIIYDLFKCITEYLINDRVEIQNNKIHSYSISTIISNNDKVNYTFNKKIDKMFK
jgi:hypothetical protein